MNPVFKTRSLRWSKSNSAANISWEMARRWSGEICPPSQQAVGVTHCTDWHRSPVSLPVPKHEKKFMSLWARNVLRLLKRFLLCPKAMVQLVWLLWPIFDSSKKEENKLSWTCLTSLHWNWTGRSGNLFLPLLLTGLWSKAEGLLIVIVLIENQSCKEHFEGSRPSVLLPA